MQDRLQGKVVVVTGAASGIGRAVAERCIREGASVLFTDRNADGAHAAVDGSGGGDRAIAQACDVTDSGQVQAAIGAAVARFGRLDGVVANAGGLVGPLTKLVDVDEADWLKDVDLNLSGTFRTLQAGARALIAQGQGGALVATGSSTAIRPFSGQMAYMAAKAGVHQLVRAMALELGEHRVRVNAMVPGVTDTPTVRAVPGYAEQVEKIVPLGALIEPEEIGGLAAFLLSDETRHMTGSIVTLDSGRTVM